VTHGHTTVCQSPWAGIVKEYQMVASKGIGPIWALQSQGSVKSTAQKNALLLGSTHSLSRRIHGRRFRAVVHSYGQGPVRRDARFEGLHSCSTVVSSRSDAHGDSLRSGEVIVGGRKCCQHGHCPSNTVCAANLNAQPENRHQRKRKCKWL
jgi:hypothetical protein